MKEKLINAGLVIIVIEAIIIIVEVITRWNPF